MERHRRQLAALEVPFEHQAALEAEVHHAAADSLDILMEDSLDKHLMEDSLDKNLLADSLDRTLLVDSLDMIQLQEQAVLHHLAADNPGTLEGIQGKMVGILEVVRRSLVVVHHIQEEAFHNRTVDSRSQDTLVARLDLSQDFWNDFYHLYFYVSNPLAVKLLALSPYVHQVLLLNAHIDTQDHWGSCQDSHTSSS